MPQCPSAYSEISATHSRCLEDVGEIVTLSESQKQAAVDMHNRIRAEVTPAAADMQKVVGGATGTDYDDDDTDDNNADEEDHGDCVDGL